MGSRFGYKEADLPITEDLSGRLLRLPAYTGLSEDEQVYVVSHLTTFLQDLRGEISASDLLLAGASER